MSFDLHQIIVAIETAVSLVGMDDTNHGKRVGYIAHQVGQKLGFGDVDLQYAFELGMVHDCGVSTHLTHSLLCKLFDWSGAHVHSEIGYRLLRNFEPLAKFAVPILYHHTPWRGLLALDLGARDVQMANLIHLADRVDVLGYEAKTNILLAREGITQAISDRSGFHFAPALVAAFLELAGRESFWIALEDRHITRIAWEMGKCQSDDVLTWPQFRQLALILSYIVDQKSPFTSQHSAKVAELAMTLATLYGLSAEQASKIEIAGLLHDLGKLHTPDQILEKPGPLSAHERAIISRHSYETYEILRRINGLNEVAQWAAFHHEAIDGTGYPFHPSEPDLCVEARIVAVADVFQALVQDRPYRQGMPLGDVMAILEETSRNGHLDRELIALVRHHSEACFEIARLDNSASSIESFLGTESFA